MILIQTHLQIVYVNPSQLSINIIVYIEIIKIECLLWWYIIPLTLWRAVHVRTI